MSINFLCMVAAAIILVAAVGLLTIRPKVRPDDD